MMFLSKFPFISLYTQWSQKLYISTQLYIRRAGSGRVMGVDVYMGVVVGVGVSAHAFRPIMCIHKTNALVVAFFVAPSL